MASTARQNVYSIIKGGRGGYSITKKERQTDRHTEREETDGGGGGGGEWNTVLLRKREKERQTDRQTDREETDRQRRGREREKCSITTKERERETD